MLPRPPEGWGDAPCFRLGCAEGDRTTEAHPHNSGTKHLQTTSALCAISSSGPCFGNQYCTLSSLRLFSFGEPQRLLRSHGATLISDFPTHCTDGKRHLGLSGQLWDLHLMWALPAARFLPPALLGGDR